MAGKVTTERLRNHQDLLLLHTHARTHAHTHTHTHTYICDNEVAMYNADQDFQALQPRLVLTTHH